LYNPPGFMRIHSLFFHHFPTTPSATITMQLFQPSTFPANQWQYWPQITWTDILQSNRTHFTSQIKRNISSSITRPQLQMSLPSRVPPFPATFPLVSQPWYTLMECIYLPEVPSCPCGKSFSSNISYKPCSILDIAAQGEPILTS
jgi:hypothetical protein